MLNSNDNIEAQFFINKKITSSEPYIHILITHAVKNKSLINRGISKTVLSLEMLNNNNKRTI